MISNKGITFDLESIRRANPNCRIMRFRAVTGNSGATGIIVSHPGDGRFWSIFGYLSMVGHASVES